MTELYELYQADREAALKKIQGMDSAMLFAELDDTLQIDVLHKSHMEWAEMPDMKLYRALLTELKNRINDSAGSGKYCVLIQTELANAQYDYFEKPEFFDTIKDAREYASQEVRHISDYPANVEAIIYRALEGV